ncbi:sensor histidine kinase [Nitrincola alkalisediminis]|uniref:sensor histidine kinase n=1 Tax=Nitrincola alkalisediminis TaxID=1366656 RepID=UPI0018770375|nr:ATP-binding protein [Nitrincola alkalisediminis]
MRFPLMFSSLKRVLILQVVAPVLIMLGVILAGGQMVIESFIEERMQRDLQLVARAIYLPVNQALERQDLEQLEESLASVFGITEVYGAYLFDTEGNRLISFGAVNPTKRQATTALEKTLVGEFAHYERIRGRNVYSFFLPLFDAGGTPSGLLQVTRRRSDMDQALVTIQYASWGGFAAVALLILGVLTYAHQRAVGRPIEKLLTSMRKVEQGDASHRAELTGPTEIRQLANGLNGMLDAMKAAEEREIAQRKEQALMSDRLRQSENMASLGQVSAGVAHELAAPLTVVDGRARRLLKRAQSPDEQRELEDIRHQTGRMTSIIQQLLTFGRASSASQQRLSVRSWVHHAESIVAEEGYPVEVIDAEDITIQGDPLGLEQVLINLLRNARQACPEGRVQVSWQSLDEGKTLALWVDDEGGGVDEAIKSQLFDPFVTTKLPGQGSGLGLAIVNRVIKEHQGCIDISESALGGARFLITLPTLVEGDVL